MKRVCACIAVCVATAAVPRVAAAESPWKAALAARITTIEGAIRELQTFPVLPHDPGLGGVTCLVGTLTVCVEPDGTVTASCAEPADECEDYPAADVCPDVCEEQGGVVVVDHAAASCHLQQTFRFVCMNPEEYAGRPSCPATLVLTYNSDRNGWVCEPPVGVVHVSTSVWDLILFEHARTGFVRDHLQGQIDAVRSCQCPGVFEPVCGVDNRSYVNSCEAKCASPGGYTPGPCAGQ